MSRVNRGGTFRREGDPDARHYVSLDELTAVQAADEAAFKYVWLTDTTSRTGIPGTGRDRSCGRLRPVGGRRDGVRADQSTYERLIMQRIRRVRNIHSL